MASQQRTVDYILEQLATAGIVSARKMFGEFRVYCDGKMVALVCDDQLFVKPTMAGRSFVGQSIEAAPYPSAKPHFLIGGDKWDDAEWLGQLVRLTAADFPTPVSGRRRK